jgi:hypothetical protein
MFIWLNTVPAKASGFRKVIWFLATTILDRLLKFEKALGPKLTNAFSESISSVTVLGISVGRTFRPKLLLSTVSAEPPPRKHTTKTGHKVLGNISAIRKWQMH